MVYLRAGALADAEADARRVIDGARESRWQFGRSRRPTSSPRCCSSAATSARRARSTRRSRELPRRGWSNNWEWGVARVEFAGGHAQQALDALLEVGRREEVFGADRPWMLPWRSAAALAAVPSATPSWRCDSPTRSVEVARRSAARARSACRSVPRHRARRRRRDRRPDEAVGLLAESPARLEHARALVDLGALMRREGKRAAAREHLTTGSTAPAAAAPRRSPSGRVASCRRAACARAASGCPAPPRSRAASCAWPAWPRRVRSTGDRADAVRDPEDRREAPGEHVLEARDRLARAAGRRARQRVACRRPCRRCSTPRTGTTRTRSWPRSPPTASRRLGQRVPRRRRDPGLERRRAIGVAVTLDVTAVETRDNETIVTAQVGGDGFNGPSHFAFAVAGERVAPDDDPRLDHRNRQFPPRRDRETVRDQMEAKWIIPTAFYVLAVGGLGITNKLSLRTLEWPTLGLDRDRVHPRSLAILLIRGDATLSIRARHGLGDLRGRAGDRRADRDQHRPDARKGEPGDPDHRRVSRADARTRRGRALGTHHAGDAAGTALIVAGVVLISVAS